MRVALCINGQPRTWEKCYQNWMNNILPGVEKDIFFHLWDYNSLPSIVNVIPGAPPNYNAKISTDEQERLIATLKPKKYKFDSREIANKRINLGLVNEYVQTPLGWWCRSQYYSLWYAAQLKHQYELENNFEYDIVFRIRTDLFFLEPVSVPNSISYNCIYSTNNGWMENVRTFMIGDTFYFADSFTYDQISQFIHGLDFMDTYNVVDSDVTFHPPEVAFYPFIRSLGIKNISWPQQFKIARTQEYANIKGELHAYEIL
jgi:hypothetical protein